MNASERGTGKDEKDGLGLGEPIPPLLPQMQTPKRPNYRRSDQIKANVTLRSRLRHERSLRCYVVIAPPSSAPALSSIPHSEPNIVKESILSDQIKAEAETLHTDANPGNAGIPAVRGVGWESRGGGPGEPTPGAMPYTLLAGRDACTFPGRLRPNQGNPQRGRARKWRSHPPIRPNQGKRPLGGKL